LDDVRSLLESAAPAAMVTYRHDGSADVSPVWFRFIRTAFEIVIAEGDAKLSHLDLDPRAVLTVFETVPPFRGVKVADEAELDVTQEVCEMRVWRSPGDTSAISTLARTWMPEDREPSCGCR
jgi:hypothetical protein